MQGLSLDEFQHAYPARSAGGFAAGAARLVTQPGFDRWLVPTAPLAIRSCIGMIYAMSVFWLPLTYIVGAAGRPGWRDRGPRRATGPSPAWWSAFSGTHQGWACGRRSWCWRASIVVFMTAGGFAYRVAPANRLHCQRGTHACAAKMFIHDRTLYGMAGLPAVGFANLLVRPLSARWCRCLLFGVRA